MLETREEKLFTNMKHRLQQASLNDRERRLLLSQVESRAEAENALVSECRKKMAILFTSNQHAAHSSAASTTRTQAAFNEVSLVVYKLHNKT